MVDLSDTVVALRAFNRFHTRVAGALEPHYMGSALGLIEARMLYEIAQADGVLATELQDRLALDAGYASRILRRFEAKDWVVRGRGRDARQRPIALTTAGRAAFDALDARTRAAVEEQLAGLDAIGHRDLSAALDHVRALLGDRPFAPWSLRPFRAGDMGTIAARQSILYDAGYGWGRGMEIVELEIVTAFLRDFNPAREQCWIADRDGRMLGSVFLVDAGDDIAQLRLLYVEPDARGLGIGAALVDACIAFARAADYRAIRLWTHSVLESARRIYAARGFVITAVETHDRFGAPEQGESWELALA